MKLYRKKLSLNGNWKFRTDPDKMGDESPDKVRFTIGGIQQDCKFFDENYEDYEWGEIAVPACWQAEGVDFNGIAWYRTRFSFNPDETDTAVRLRFEAVDYFADVWLNGYYLGSHEGFYNHFEYNVTPWIKSGENLLVVRVDSPRGTNVRVGPAEINLVKGALQNWDCNNLDFNPGGIYADVSLLLSRDIYIERMKITPFVDPGSEHARVLCKFRVFNTTNTVKTVDFDAAVAPANFEGAGESNTAQHALIPGMSEFDIWLDIDKTELWWPWDMGEQNLYRLTLKASENDNLLDEQSDRFGLRHLRQVPGTWECYVNGKRIFCKGPNYISEQLLSNMNREKYETDVRLMKEANMNMVRVYCVVEKQEFYDVCDEMGMMILQDFPSQGPLSNSNEMVRRAVPMARDMVNQLYNHPSILIWCLGAQPNIENFEKLCMAMKTAAGHEDPYRFLQQGSSVWEWEIAKEKYDWPVDYHILCGWFPPDLNYLIKPFRQFDIDQGPAGNSVSDLKYKKREFLEFVGEFGPPEALPEMDSLRKFIPEKDMWPVNWKLFERRCLHGAILLRWIDEPKSIDQLIEESQTYQAFLYKYHVEFYRRHKYDPCNGCLFFHFKDVWPAITASVIDYYGKKKKAYHTLKQAFSPVHVIMDWPDLEGLPSGSKMDHKVYIINDFYREFPGYEVKWQINDRNDKRLESGALTGNIQENCIQAAGTIDWQVPGADKAKYTICFELAQDGTILSTNEYEIKTRAG